MGETLMLAGKLQITQDKANLFLKLKKKRVSMNLHNYFRLPVVNFFTVFFFFRFLLIVNLHNCFRLPVVNFFNFFFFASFYRTLSVIVILPISPLSFC